MILGVLLGVLLAIAVNVSAGLISSPPPLGDLPVALQHYLTEIRNNLHVPAITTTAPNGSRSGRKGELVLYNNSGTYSLYCNTDGSTTWQAL